MRKALWGAPLLLAAAVFSQEFKVGSKVSDFTVFDLRGQPAAFSSLRGATTVVVFIATQCPVSNAYNERMNAVYRDYSAKGVKFVFINANSTEPPAEVGEHARTHGFLFPVYKDQGNIVADRFGASVTPETFVITADNVIQYHGYIDDSQNPARIQKQGLRNALDAVLANKPVATAETKAFGCTIKRRKATT